MHSFKTLFLALLTLTAVSLSTAAQETQPSSTGLGEALLKQLWANIKTPDMDAIKQTMSDGFQSVHQDGANDRTAELELIKNLKLGDYTLSDIQITQDGPVIVASYFVSTTEVIEGKTLSKTPAARLSVFMKTDSGWKWVAHANLKPLK